MKLFLAYALSLCLTLSSSRAKSISSADRNVELDLVSMLEEPVVDRGEVFSQAIKILSNYQTASSCHRLASANLLSSCKDLDSQDPQRALDLVKSTFAARLAVCELVDAHAAIPPQCSPLIPTKRNEDNSFRCMFSGSRCSGPSSQKGSYGFVGLSEKQINHCTGALESRPQWWTSYSNARQNAFAICHAMRTEIERDELLQLHKAVAHVDGDIMDTLAQQIKDTKEQLTRSAAFASAVQKLQDQIKKDMDLGQSSLTAAVLEMKKRFAENIESIVTTFSARAEAAASKMEKLDEKIDQSLSNTNIAADRVQAVLQNMASSADNAAAVQDTTLESSRKAALAVQNEISLVRDSAVPELLSQLVALQNQMHANAEYLSLIHQRHGNLDTRVASLDEKFATLQAGTNAVEQALREHIAHQQRAFSGFENGMTDVHAKLNETVTGMVAHVQDAAREAVADIKTLSSRFLGGWAVWKQLVLVGVLALYDVKAAALVTVLSVFLTVFAGGLQQYSTTPTLFQLVRGIHFSPQEAFIFVLIASGTMLAIAVLLCALHLLRTKRCQKIGIESLAVENAFKRAENKAKT